MCKGPGQAAAQRVCRTERPVTEQRFGNYSALWEGGLSTMVLSVLEGKHSLDT